MIATITVIAEIAEKKKFRDHMETTLQRSQRQRSLRDKTIYISAIVVAAIAGEEFPKIAAIAEVFFFLSDRSDHSDRSHHMAYFKRKDCLQRNLYLNCVSL